MTEQPISGVAPIPGKTKYTMPGYDFAPQATPKDTQIHKGYRQLNQVELALVDEIKSLGNVTISGLIDRLVANGADARWIAIARTNLQQGLMALTRAVTKPEGF